MRLTAAILLTAPALALAACGGSGGHSTSTNAAMPSSNTRSTPAATSTVTSTVTTTTPTVTAARPRACTAADLSARFLGQQGATGHGELGFKLRNISSRSCHTYGFPGVLFLDRAGRPLPTNSTRTTHDFFGVVPKVALTVRPGATVSFRVGVTHVPTSETQCTTAYALQVIPPDDTHTIRTRIPGGAFECRAATVSPLRPGTSAYP